MFDKVKQLNELRKMRSQAQTLQKSLSGQSVGVEERGIKVVVSLDQKIQYLTINGSERKDLKEVINDALSRAQKEAAKKMMEMGGGLSGLLKNLPTGG